MKVSKILSVLLALVMVIGCFASLPVSATETEKTVYVSNNGDDNAVGSVAAPVKTIKKAAEIIEAATSVASAKIILQTNVENTDVNVYLKGNAHITIEGANSNTYLILNASSGNIVCECDTTFSSNLIIVAKQATAIKNIASNLTIDADVKAKDNVIDNITDETNKTKSVSVYAAAFASGTSNCGARTVLNKGTYGDVYGVGQKHGGSAATANGNVYLEINQDVTVGYFGFVGTKQNVTINGNYDVHVNGAKISNFRDISDKGTVSTLLDIEGRTTLKMCGKPTVTFDQYNSTDYFTVGTADTAPTAGVWYKGGFVLDTSGFDGDYSSLKSSVGTWSFIKDDITYADFSVAGMQNSDTYTVEEREYRNARFIIGVRDYETIETATVTIVAKDGDTVVRSLTGYEITKVYESVTANVAGVNTTVTAEQMGANFIMAITVEGVPTDVTITSFEVTPTINGVAAPTKTITYPAS